MTLDEMEKNIDELSLDDLLDAMEEAKILISDADLAFNPKLIDLYDKRHCQYRAFRARILRVDAEKEQMIRDMAWLAYGDKVLDTGMNEYADADEWINSYIEGLKHE